jgi:glycosyltransferase involved in cell wall biosynthesis
LIGRLLRIIRQESPDIVHLHSRRGADLLGGIAGRLAGARVVHSRRVDNPESPFIVRLKYRLYDRVITISDGIYQVLLQEGVKADRLRCVRSAVSPGSFKETCDRTWFLETFSLDDDVVVMGVIAQLIPRKGHRYLFQAMPDLLGDFPRLKLLIFGKGALEQELKQQVSSMGLTEHVAFAGFRTDLPRILPCLDLVVHPALMEGLGISLLQAAGAGVPIVAVNAGGMPEIVREGENGVLVPPGDSRSLSEAISRLLSDTEMRRGMGEAGKKLVAAEFTVARMVEGNLMVYRELMTERGG